MRKSKGRDNVVGMMMQIKQRVMIMLVLLASVVTVQAEVRAPGKPDLSGTYDTGTLTPLQRPEFLGEIEHLYVWVADLLNWAAGLVIDWTWEDESDLTEKHRRRVATATTLPVLAGLGAITRFGLIRVVR